MRTLITSDWHLPFIHPRYLQFLQDVRTYYQTTHTAVLGDLIDNHALSRWPKNPEAVNISREAEIVKAQMRQIEEIFPDADYVIGNHDQRLVKRLYDIGIPDSFAQNFKQLYGIPDGWTIYQDSLIVDGVYCYHGHMKGGMMPALSMAKFVGRPVICGHHHGTAGIHRISPLGNDLWGVDLGCGVDISSYGMYYMKENLNKPILGCAVLIDGHPIHITMEDFYGCYKS